MRLTHGLTLVELLVVLALVAGGLVLTRSTVLATAAKHVSSTIRAARAEAIVTAKTSACWAETVSASSVNVRLPLRGLLFTPDGLPRACDGGGVGNTTILLEHRGRHAAVVVSSLGRVRWELR